MTGLGAVTPLGNTRDEFWRELIAGHSGVAQITSFDPKDLSTTIAAEVKGFDAEELIGRREARRMDRYAQFAFVAAREALEDAQVPRRPRSARPHRRDRRDRHRRHDHDSGHRHQGARAGSVAKTSPFFIPMLMANAAPAQISMAYKLRGPLFAVSSACASSNDGIAVAYEFVARGDCVGDGHRRRARRRSATSR